jgi:hypothetical protein
VVDLFNETPSTKGQFLEGAFKFSGKLIGGKTPTIVGVE